MSLDNVSDHFLYHCAQILMAAAYADGTVDGIEEDTILGLFTEMSEEDEPPRAAMRGLKDFDEEDFNLEAAAEELIDEDEPLRYKVLQMAATLREADGVIELAEDDFLLRLAEALDLEAEYIEEFAAGTFEPDDALIDKDYLDDEP
jgi:uncharacterized tellurite resistance protein B-like protein